MSVKLTLIGRTMSKDNEKLFSRRSGRAFTSAKFKSYEYMVGWQAQEQMKRRGWSMFTVPIVVNMTFYFKTNVRHDLFNCPKSVCDALNKIVWKDDRLIHEGQLKIAFSPEERIEVEVYPVESMPLTSSVATAGAQASANGI